jgi:hypothetical protein
VQSRNSNDKPRPATRAAALKDARADACTDPHTDTMSIDSAEASNAATDATDASWSKKTVWSVAVGCQLVKEDGVVGRRGCGLSHQDDAPGIRLRQSRLIVLNDCLSPIEVGLELTVPIQAIGGQCTSWQCQTDHQNVLDCIARATSIVGCDGSRHDQVVRPRHVQLAKGVNPKPSLALAAMVGHAQAATQVEGQVDRGRVQQAQSRCQGGPKRGAVTLWVLAIAKAATKIPAHNKTAIHRRFWQPPPCVTLQPSASSFDLLASHVLNGVGSMEAI